MLCQRCQERSANVHIMQIINNEKKEMFLCESCARETQQINFVNPIKIDTSFGISDFLKGLLATNLQPYTIKTEKPLPVEKCSVCGMTLDEFSKGGKLGCANCYNTFKSALESVFKRVHGGIYHNGKMPHSVGGGIRSKRELETLRGDLLRAVQKEEYEEAAVLRDKIKALEQEIKEA